MIKQPQSNGSFQQWLHIGFNACLLIQQAQELKNLELYIMEPMLLMDMNQKTQL